MCIVLVLCVYCSTPLSTHKYTQNISQYEGSNRIHLNTQKYGVFSIIQQNTTKYKHNTAGEGPPQKKKGKNPPVPLVVSLAVKVGRAFLLLQHCAPNGVRSPFCFSNYLTSSLDREGAPGGPAGFTYRQGRGRLPLLHSRGVWGERASVPPGKGRPANGACFAEVISLESRGGMSALKSRSWNDSIPFEN